ncbi:antibiotic biosynthesis monooxygenase family protein [Frankia sp. Cppng1_Ct_nod]|uniref:antibiotic biosynthesis monooxygenase family protein n=1 Tax=Frankia sp. Cppng1_Ct_nod TaxID=2897162 RepID=UPI001041985B|nr:antibiotic biosynthesis monooxygenase family protein [Frankia sp. Cppng1_Ct_nod]
MIRATLRMRVRPGREEDFTAAWKKIALTASRTPGNLRQALLRGGPHEFVITSDWDDRESFHAFERSPEQDALTAPLRELRESAQLELTDILSHFDSTGDDR